MRADMAKVIVERPRFGSSMRGYGKGYWRKLNRIALEELPKRERMKTHGHSKRLNEHLGPLRRYLESRLGEPWNKTFAQICAHVDRSNPVQDHVRDHLDDYVLRHVQIINGKLCVAEGWHFGRPVCQSYKPFYVCPKTGLLKRIRWKSKRTR